MSQRFVHALVAEAFHGPRPEGMQVCHNNGDKDDNRADNLRWGTPAQNQADRERHGTGRHGIPRPVKRLDECQIAAVREFHGANGGSITATACHFGIPRTTAADIINGRTHRRQKNG